LSWTTATIVISVEHLPEMAAMIMLTHSTATLENQQYHQMNILDCVREQAINYYYTPVKI
jgi:hypothetical protein